MLWSAQHFTIALQQANIQLGSQYMVTRRRKQSNKATYHGARGSSVFHTWRQLHRLLVKPRKTFDPYSLLSNLTLWNQHWSQGAGISKKHCLYAPYMVLSLYSNRSPCFLCVACSTHVACSRSIWRLWSWSAIELEESIYIHWIGRDMKIAGRYITLTPPPPLQAVNVDPTP